MFFKLSKMFRNKKSTSEPANGANNCNVWSPAHIDACKQFVHTDGTSEVTSVTVAEPSTCLFGAKNGKLTTCRYTNGEVIQKWSGHEKEITKVACGGQSCELYASASRDKTIGVWQRGSDNTETGPRCRYSGHDLAVTGVTLSPSGSLMLSGSRDNSVRLWDVTAGQCVRMTAFPQNVVTHVCWSRASGSRMVAQSSEDKTVRLWDTRSLHVAVATPPKQYIQTFCDLSRYDDRHCLSTSNGFGGSGCEATLWDLRACAQPLREFTGHCETVAGGCFVPSSSHFMAATCSNDGTVRLWNCDTGSALATVSIPACGPLTSITADGDGAICVSSLFAGIQVLSIRQNGAGTISLQRTAAF